MAIRIKFPDSSALVLREASLEEFELAMDDGLEKKRTISYEEDGKRILINPFAVCWIMEQDGKSDELDE